MPFHLGMKPDEELIIDGKITIRVEKKCCLIIAADGVPRDKILKRRIGAPGHTFRVLAEPETDQRAVRK